MTALPPRQPNKCARCGNDWYDTHTCPALGSQTAVPMPNITRGWPSTNPVSDRSFPKDVCGHCLGPKLGDHARFCAKCVAEHADDYQSTVDPRPIYWVGPPATPRPHVRSATMTDCAVVDVFAVNYLMKKPVTRDEVERVLHALGLANYEAKKRKPEKGTKR